MGALVALWHGAGLVTARSWVQIPAADALYQRQFGVPFLQGRLMSTGESWGVNGHTTCLAASTVVSWGLSKQRSMPPYMGSRGSGRTLLVFFVTYFVGFTALQAAFSS